MWELEELNWPSLKCLLGAFNSTRYPYRNATYAVEHVTQVHKVTGQVHFLKGKMLTSTIEEYQKQKYCMLHIELK